MTHVTCRLTSKTGINSGTLRSVIEYGLPLPLLSSQKLFTTRQKIQVYPTLQTERSLLFYYSGISTQRELSKNWPGSLVDSITALGAPTNLMYSTSDKINTGMGNSFKSGGQTTFVYVTVFIPQRNEERVPEKAQVGLFDLLYFTDHVLMHCDSLFFILFISCCGQCFILSFFVIPPTTNVTSKFNVYLNYTH